MCLEDCKDVLKALDQVSEKDYEGNKTIIVQVPQYLHSPKQPMFLLSSTDLRCNWPSNQVLFETQKRVIPGCAPKTYGIDLNSIPNLTPLQPLQIENIPSHSRLMDDYSEPTHCNPNRDFQTFSRGRIDDSVNARPSPFRGPRRFQRGFFRPHSWSSYNRTYARSPRRMIRPYSMLRKPEL